MKFTDTLSGGIEITVEIPDDATVDEVLEVFTNFLRACGYVIPTEQSMMLVDDDNDNVYLRVNHSEGM